MERVTGSGGAVSRMAAGLIASAMHRLLGRIAAALPPLAVAAGAACAQSADRDSLPLHVFRYDRSAPLDFRDSLVRTVGDVELRTMSFASPRGGRATGYLFVPRAGGRHAGMLLQHGMPSRAYDMIPQGMQLARLGAVVVALDAPFARRAGEAVVFTEADSAEQVALIVDLQRAVDLLIARRDVDPARLGYLGVSYGGAMGALFAGVERRLRTYLLIVGDGGLVTHFTGPEDQPGPLGQLDSARRERWLAAMRPIEPIRFIQRAPPASILLQSGRADVLVPPADAERLHSAARDPKTIEWYDAGHRLPVAAQRRQLAWLHRTLGMREPD